MPALRRPLRLLLRGRRPDAITASRARSVPSLKGPRGARVRGRPPRRVVQRGQLAHRACLPSVAAHVQSVVRAVVGAAGGGGQGACGSDACRGHCGERGVHPRGRHCGRALLLVRLLRAVGVGVDAEGGGGLPADCEGEELADLPAPSPTRPQWSAPSSGVTKGPQMSPRLDDCWQSAFSFTQPPSED